MAVEIARLQVTGDQYSEMSVSSSAFPWLQTAFQDKPVLAVTVIGQEACGQAEFLSKLTSSDAFSSEDTAETVLRVYPQPLLLQDTPLLLMELSGFERVNDDYLKMLYVSLTVTNWVVVFLGKMTLFSNLRTILSVVTEANGKRKTGIERIYVIIDAQDSLTRGAAVKQLQELQTHPLFGCLQFVALGVPLSDSLFTQFHTQLSSQARSSLQAGYTSLQEVAHSLDLLSRQFPLHPTFSDFAEEIPNADRLIHDRQVYHSASTQPLFTIDPFGEIQLNSQALDYLLRSQYDPTTPTVVLMILSPPGHGKSTLLNHISAELLRFRNPDDKFRTGNTSTHTTTHSEFLPVTFHCPPNYQVLLVDLEGLEGTETIHKRAAEAQKLLVAAVLALASVPCIIVKNDRHSLTFIEEKLQAISSHQHEFGYEIHKINLIFYDKDENSGPPPEIMSQFVRNCQVKYGLERINVEFINKPSFVACEKITIRRFVRKLLEKSAYPKRNSDGNPVFLPEILGNLSQVVDSVKNDTEIILTSEEEKAVKAFLSTKNAKIDEITVEIRTDRDNLTEKSNSEVRIFKDQLKYEISDLRVGVRRVIESKLDVLIREKQEKLELIENLYRQMQSRSRESLESEVAKLEIDPVKQRQVVFHYTSVQRGEVLVRKQPGSLGKTLLVSGVLLGALIGSWMLCSYVWEWVKTDKVSLTTLCGSILSGVVVTSVSQQASQLQKPFNSHGSKALLLIHALLGVMSSLTLALCLEAHWSEGGVATAGVGLMLWLRHRLIQKQGKWLWDTAEVCYMSEDVSPFYAQMTVTELPVLLLIGRNSPSQTLFLSRFLTWCYPYSLQNSPKVNSEGLQIYPIAYFHESNSLRNGLVVNISLQTGVKSSQYRSFINKSSCVLLFLDDAAELNPSTMSLFEPARTRIETYVCYTGSGSQANRAKNQLLDLNYEASLKQVDSIGSFAKEMYREKLRKCRLIERSEVKTVCRGPLQR